MRSFFRFVFSLRTIVAVLLIGALVGGGAYLWWIETAGASGPAFRTEPVKKQNLTATITATGTIEPEEVVDVGAQVQGQVLKFGVDPTDSTKTIDYCTPVTKGTVLAEIDPTIYQAHLDQAKAAVASAEAVLANAQAALAKSVASRDALLDTYQRDRSSPGAVAAGQIVTDKGAYDVAVADGKVQEAAIASAQANLVAAKANLKEAQTNLDYCTIKAPVDGVIVDRRVNVGQTVVASLSAPSLFLLAKNLAKMQVWVSVNEADIGNIRKGQDVTFTVDARPGKVYPGKVIQIRYNATMTQNVVTYTVVVETDNPPLDAPTGVKVVNKEGQPVTANVDRELLPYLTANVTFLVAVQKDALLVPNSALRWKPQLAQVAPDARDAYEQSMRKKSAKESSSDDAAPATSPPDKGDTNPDKSHDHPGGPASHGMVWVQDGAFVRPIKVVTGLTDGVMTEVMLKPDEKLEVGTQLITGETQAAGAAGVTNPFAPPPVFQRQTPKKKDDQ